MHSDRILSVLTQLLSLRAPRKHFAELLQRAKGGIQHFIPLIQFSDSTWATCTRTRKSISGNCTFMYGNLVSWCTQKQPVIALSSCEAEYVALASTFKEGCYLCNLFGCFVEAVSSFLGQPNSLVYCDNNGTMHMAENQVNNSRTKHIDLRFHFIRSKLRENFALDKVHTDENVADFFTKPLAKPKFEKFKTMVLSGLNATEP